jgi:putative ABC transport system substrate-binding protein
LVAYPLPAIWRTEGAEQGGLIGYGPRNDAVFRQCALQVAKLLRGATVADVPLSSRPSLNSASTQSARALSIAIPPSILARADQVIE